MKPRLGERLTIRWLGRRLPARTIRLRLTLVYGGLFVASGAALLAITYVLVSHATDGVLVGTRGKSTFVIDGTTKSQTAPRRPTVQSVRKRGSHAKLTPLTPQQAAAQRRRDQALAEQQHDAEMRQLFEQSGLALAIMTALSIMLGWLVAGHVLRPLRTITNAAREISASDLHRRLALAGPDDELTRLGNTFDGLLERLEASFTAQRQFVANASHELRTPLTFERALLEVALADPNASAQTLRRTCEQLLANSEHQEELIEALLILSRSQRGIDQRERFDLAAVSENVLATMREQAEHRGIHLDVRLQPAETSGDARLAERLIGNLVDNGIRHNHTLGRVELRTTKQADRSIVSVANSGPIVPADELERLFQPFQRLGTNRTEHRDGIGLGLSIVKAVAAAHDATLTVQPRPNGGLQIEVAFPQPLRDALAVAAPANPPTRQPERLSPHQMRVCDLRHARHGIRHRAFAPLDFGFTAWILACGGLGAGALLVR
jgi:signal transduction histidine kinase